MKPIPKGRRYAGCFLVAVPFLSFLFAIALAEVLLPLVRPQDIFPADIEAYLKKHPGLSSMEPSPNADRFYGLKPNLDRSAAGFRLITDEKGFRIGNERIAERKGALRLAVVGDSTPFGWLVNYEETYPELFRRALESRTSMPVVLRNFSIYGYNSRQELALLKEQVLDWKPDLLLVHHDFNDSDPTGAGHNGLVTVPDFLPVTYGDNPFHSSLIKVAKRRWRAWKISRAQKAVNQDPRNRKLGDYFYAGPAYEDHMEALRNIAALAKARGIVAALVLFDSDVHPEQEAAEKKRRETLYPDLLRRCREYGFLVWDLYPAVQTALHGHRWKDLSAWWVGRDGKHPAAQKDDRHPNEAGHVFIADTLTSLSLQQPEIQALLKRKTAGS